MSTRVAQLGFAAAVALCATSAPAAADAIRWNVVNNFGLISGADAQARFKRESDTYIACMRRRFSPGQCDNGRSTFGLTRTPYPVHFDSKALKYMGPVLHPVDGEGKQDHVGVSLSLEGVGKQDRCIWTIAGEDIRTTACRDVRLFVPLERDTKVDVKVRGKSRTAETSINVRRVVIATFGDSFMSGEGNPHMRSTAQPVRSENWLEQRCHRSLLTSSALAAFWYAEANPKTYVAYFNFACSGSTAPIGLLGEYEGILSSRMLDNLRGENEEAVHFRGRVMPSQIAQAREVLCRKGQCIEPDAVFLSIGVNTLKFSSVVSDLAKPGCDKACLDRLQKIVDTGFEELKGSGKYALKAVYETLSKELSPKAAFAVEYPDPSRDENGKFCRGNLLFPTLSGLGVGRVDVRENKWAFENVLDPLNSYIAEVANSTPGWGAITGTVEATRKNGFCSTQRFFNSGQDAKGTSGTLHPNAAGHHAIAQLLLAKLNQAVSRDAAPQR